MAKDHVALTASGLDRLEEAIRETRKSLRTNLSELRQNLTTAAQSSQAEIREQLSVQRQITLHPWPSLAGAFAGGLILSAVLSGARKNGYWQEHHPFQRLGSIMLGALGSALGRSTSQFVHETVRPALEKLVERNIGEQDRPSSIDADLFH